MPYKCEKLRGGKWAVVKKATGEKVGTHKSEASCYVQLQALYASEAKGVVINGDIVDDTPVDSAIRTTKEAIVLTVTSNGGSYLAALSMGAKLNSSGKEVIAIVNSYAFSAGAVLVQFASTRLMAANALMMLHSPLLASRDAMTAEELKAKAETLEACEKTLLVTLSARTGKSEEELKEFLKEERYLTAEKCLDMGFIDAIIPMKDLNEGIYNVSGIPDLVLNHVKRIENMPLKEVLDKYEVQYEEGTEEETLVKFIESLLNRKPEESSSIKNKATLPESVINLVTRARESEIDNLVAAGKLVPAAANKLKTKFINRKAVLEHVDESGDIIDGFDEVVDAIKSNEEVISFSEKTGLQKVSKQDDSDILIKNMEKRGN